MANWRLHQPYNHIASLTSNRRSLKRQRIAPSKTSSGPTSEFTTNHLFVLYNPLSWRILIPSYNSAVFPSILQTRNQVWSQFRSTQLIMMIQRAETLLSVTADRAQEEHSLLHRKPIYENQTHDLKSGPCEILQWQEPTRKSKKQHWSNITTELDVRKS